ncbi:porin [Methylococcus capsulatus]|uniref:porin n=1 Tax=Methylococcus capsulatus TaxID=414 RepID=UPI002017C937|nr:porin [Methylococcus capsulatus]UQN10967.1 porin [Methylococcus capsulatus]
MVNLFSLRMRGPILAGAALLWVASGMAPVSGAGLEQARGVFEMLPDGMNPNGADWMQSLRLTLGGWIDAGLTHNFDEPGSGYNGPVTFSDRSDEFQPNQVYLYLERAVDRQGESFDLGGRLDLLYGTDAWFSQAFGDPQGSWDRQISDNNRYSLAVPQAYLEALVPVGRGLAVKLGHFYTVVGVESVMAPENFFYSHSYAMQYGEPFTHTGIRFSYQPTDNLLLDAAAVTGSQFAGWDGVFDHSLENWAFVGGGTWTSDSGETSLSINGSNGTVTTVPRGELGFYSLVAQHDLTLRLHAILQHDHGWISGDGKTSSWYGLVQYLSYDLADDLSLGLRGEWFRDDDGIRVLSPARAPTMGLGPGSYYAVTAGVKWSPLPWLTVRPNLRYDWSDGTRPFDDGNATSQILLSADVIVSF